MKVLLADLVQTQKRVDELSKNFRDAMLAPPTEPAVPELDLTEVLKDLGVALTEDQSTRLVERVQQHDIKRRRVREPSDVSMEAPPGLGEAQEG